MSEERCSCDHPRNVSISFGMNFNPLEMEPDDTDHLVMRYIPGECEGCGGWITVDMVDERLLAILTAEGAD